jgi:SAM-dependent methyltransferase
MSNLPGPYSAHYQINRCSCCGLLRSSPILTEEGVNNLYKKSSETNVTQGEEENVKRTMKLYYDMAGPFLSDKERILDIGCDMGYLLDVASEDGFKEIYGLEPNPVACKVANKLAGANISDMFYESVNYPAGFFDLIVMIHVLDHLVDPGAVLLRAYRDLKPGGLLTAVVHNVESVLGRIMGERFPPFNLYHFYFFSKKTLGALFNAYGFEVVRIASSYNCYSLGFFINRFPLLPKSMRQGLSALLGILKLDNLSLTIPVGNIEIVARRSI